MNRRLFALAISGLCCLTSLAAGAADKSPTPAPSPVATPQSSPKPAADEKKAPTEDVFIRLKAPVFSPLFAKVPLAVVNDEPITMEELKKSLGTIHQGMAEGKPVPKQNFPELLKRLVNALLIIQEARNMELDKLPEIKGAVDEFSEKERREMLLKDEIKNVKADEKEVDKLYKQKTSEWRLKSLIVDKLEDVKTFESELKAGKKYDDLYAKYIKDGRAKEGGQPDTFLTRDVIPPSMLTKLEKMKVGELSKPLPLEKGYLFYRVEEIRHKEDPTIKEQVRQELDAKARVAALESLQKAMIKKHVTQSKQQLKLLDQLNFDNVKKFEGFLKDKRAIADVKGEKPVTVAALAEAIANKYYHGVERAAEGKKINKEKKAILNDLLGTIALNKEAKERRIEQTDEFRSKVRNLSNSLLFGTFVNKVVRPEIVVTQDELQAAYKEHAKEFMTMEAYKLDAIAFENQKKAEEALDKLRKGADFKFMKSNAEGRVSMNKALASMFEGEAIARTNLPEDLQKVVEGTKAGDYRAFSDGKLGYVIAVVEYVPPRVKTYKEVEEAIKEIVFYEKLNKGIETWANKLRSSSDVQIYADFGDKS